MEMERAFIDLVVHVFTLEWAKWALPISLVMSLLTKRIMAGIIAAILAVALHHIAPIALPVFLAGGDAATIPALLQTALPALEPLSLAAEFVAYAFLIVVFSLTRQDIFRPGVGEH